MCLSPPPHRLSIRKNIKCQLNYEPWFLPTHFDNRFGDKSLSFVSNAGLTGSPKTKLPYSVTSTSCRALTRCTSHTRHRGWKFSAASKSMGVKLEAEVGGGAQKKHKSGRDASDGPRLKPLETQLCSDAFASSTPPINDFTVNGLWAAALLKLPVLPTKSLSLRLRTAKQELPLPSAPLIWAVCHRYWLVLDIPSAGLSGKLSTVSYCSPTCQLL